jgi:hypothetical protein
MTNDEKLIALQSCVFEPNCCVTGFQTEECFEPNGNCTVRLYFANGLVMGTLYGTKRTTQEATADTA